MLGRRIDYSKWRKPPAGDILASYATFGLATKVFPAAPTNWYIMLYLYQPFALSRVAQLEKHNNDHGICSLAIELLSFPLPSSVPERMSSNGSSAAPSVTSGSQSGGSSSLYRDENANGQHDAWKSATESTLAKCSPDQKLILSQIKTPEAARAALMTVELQQRSRRSQTVLGKIRRVLDAVKVFEDAMRIYSNAGMTELCLL